MNSTFSLLLVFLTQLFMPRHNAQMRLLKAQILRTRIPLSARAGTRPSFAAFPKSLAAA